MAIHAKYKVLLSEDDVHPVAPEEAYGSLAHLTNRYDTDQIPTMRPSPIVGLGAVGSAILGTYARPGEGLVTVHEGADSDDVLQLRVGDRWLKVQAPHEAYSVGHFCRARKDMYSVGRALRAHSPWWPDTGAVHNYTWSERHGAPAASAPQEFLVLPDDEHASWLGAAARRLDHLLRLPTNWDGYHSGAAEVNHALAALNYLRRVMWPGTLAPAIVPLSGGGIQLEWHSGGLDLEITFSSDADSGVYWEDLNSGLDFEGPLEENVREVRSLLARLS